MGKTISIKTLMNTKYHTYGFSKELLKMIGDAEVGFSGIVWGHSGNGKSTFVAILCKMLSEHGKVYYNSIESGPGLAFQALGKHTGLIECGENFTIGDKDNLEEMRQKLKTNRCRFYIIDSVQAMGLTYQQWQKLRKDFPNKAIILISWEGSGTHPKGEHAKSIRYMSDIKIRVYEGLALIDSRFGKTPPYKVPNIYEKFQESIEAERQKKLGKGKTGQPSLFEDQKHGN